METLQEDPAVYIFLKDGEKNSFSNYLTIVRRAIAFVEEAYVCIYIYQKEKEKGRRESQPPKKNSYYRSSCRRTGYKIEETIRIIKEREETFRKRRGSKRSYLESVGEKRSVHRSQ